jgi:S-adenosylmethionine decarboxylase
MMRYFNLLLLLICFSFCGLSANIETNSKTENPTETSKEFEFVGFHLVGSYLNCDKAKLRDVAGLKEAMCLAVDASGATLLKAVDFVFPPDGFTMVMLLSESHASIHTYPEHDACFVDFFTCGRNCSSEKFDQVLRNYLNPKTANTRLLSRDDSVSEVK